MFFSKPTCAETYLDPLARDGVLLQARGSVFDESVFLCLRGRRHSVRSAERLKELGFRWPEDILPVSEQVLKAFQPGGNAPGAWSAQGEAMAALRGSLDMREFAAAGLVGFGLEVGAGASPFPVPLHCQVLYGDRIPYDELLKEMYPGQHAHDLVVPDLITDFDSFTCVADDSLDFIIGCHVIEHTRNPIGSIATAHRKLKRGGKLLLVIPDMHRTFDRTRQPTTLEHLCSDYEQPNRQRDYAHYEEFYRLALPVAPDAIDQTAMVQFERGYAIHYHVWDYPSFATMIEHIRNHVVDWSGVWSHQTLSNVTHDIEFYYLLTK